VDSRDEAYRLAQLGRKAASGFWLTACFRLIAPA
jgi:hypothetical protein